MAFKMKSSPAKLFGWHKRQQKKADTDFHKRFDCPIDESPCTVTATSQGLSSGSGSSGNGGVGSHKTVRFL